MGGGAKLVGLFVKAGKTMVVKCMGWMDSSLQPKGTRFTTGRLATSIRTAASANSLSQAQWTAWLRFPWLLRRRAQFVPPSARGSSLPHPVIPVVSP